MSDAIETVPHVDAELTAELHKRWDAARVQFGDVYSAVCRPGSWEWALPAAAMLRDLLRDNGYQATPDEVATWRLVWKRITDEGNPQ